MRIRTRIIPGVRSGGSVSAYHGIAAEAYHIGVADDPAVLMQETRDEKSFPHLFNPMLNRKIELKVHGIQGGFGEADGERPYQTVHESDGLTQALGYIPTMAILPYAASVWPEFTRQANSNNHITNKQAWTNWALEKWTGPKPSIGDGFSLINFIVEWKESLRMIASYSARNLSNRWHSVMGADQSASDKVKALAGERLQYVYGSKLFFRDAETLLRILRSWKQRADRFLDQSGYIQKTYKKPVRISSDWETWAERATPVSLISDSYTHMRSRWTYSAHAVLAYSYHVPAMKGLIARVAQLSDSLGVNLNASIVWDALPLSFVIDWYVNIGDWLRENADYGSWVKAEVKVLDFCYSAKVEEFRQLLWRRPYVQPLYPDGVQVSELAEATATWYHRIRDKPPVFGKTNFDLTNEPWTLERVVNATALAVTRGSRTAAQRRKAKSGRYVGT